MAHRRIVKRAWLHVLWCINILTPYIGPESFRLVDMNLNASRFVIEAETKTF